MYKKIKNIKKLPSISDIEDEFREIYDITLSSSAISIITNKIMQAASEWQNRRTKQEQSRTCSSYALQGGGKRAVFFAR